MQPKNYIFSKNESRPPHPLSANRTSPPSHLSKHCVSDELTSKSVDLYEGMKRSLREETTRLVARYIVLKHRIHRVRRAVHHWVYLCFQVHHSETQVSYSTWFSTSKYVLYTNKYIFLKPKFHGVHAVVHQFEYVYFQVHI